MTNTLGDLSGNELFCASFAESLLTRAESQGRSASDCFIAFAGLVGGIDAKIAADCLIALDGAIGDGANAKNR
jgi:hypothetical protein